jgi:hypothetical protein
VGHTAAPSRRCTAEVGVLVGQGGSPLRALGADGVAVRRPDSGVGRD